MARTREIYPTDQVIHLWAHQTQDRARNGSNVRFEGPLLYSYSTVIAQLETDANGRIWAFTSSESLTMTTAKHVNASRRATIHLAGIETPAFAGRWSSCRRTPAKMLQPLAEQLLDDFKRLPRLRTRLQWAVENYENRRQNLRACAAAFHVSLTIDLPEVTEDFRTKAREILEKERARKEQKRLVQLEREEEQREKDQDAFTAWITTGAGSCPYSHRKYGADQLTIKGETVVTSQGAEAPLEHVRKAIVFYLSRQYRERDTNGIGGSARYSTKFHPYHTNGHKIPLGHFTLDEIDESGNVKAGCHRFSASEIARFIEQWREVLS